MDFEDDIIQNIHLKVSLWSEMGQLFNYSVVERKTPRFYKVPIQLILLWTYRWFVVNLKNRSIAPCLRIYVRKYREKNLENKNFGKKVLGKMSLEIKSCVLDSWDFFPKIVWGLPIKSQEIRSQGKKSWRKEIRGKEKPRKKSQVSGNLNSVI